MITHTRLKELLLYNPTTGEFTWLVDRMWCVKKGDHAGSLLHGNKGRRRDSWVISVCGRRYKRARLAWFWMNAEWPSQEVDHRDTDALNDRWDNLRLATRFQQEMNKGVRKNNKTGLKGASLCDNGTYRASIMRNGVQRQVWGLKTPQEAHSVYVEWARQATGEYFRA